MLNDIMRRKCEDEMQREGRTESRQYTREYTSRHLEVMLMAVPGFEKKTEHPKLQVRVPSTSEPSTEEKKPSNSIVRLVAAIERRPPRMPNDKLGLIVLVCF
ncbi:hypothetical protein GWI33_006985 [Rhynchophorus ferrugineus]|uniref:Uncharacterized protein n=1 Tax=Rhynchophorus ferrugineus TaxID=354439 RepID=A0A834IEY3_RHYFE|nr:hypothetical protein GWI33_006985 [Rhynchophorus ferrugineus]